MQAFFLNFFSQTCVFNRIIKVIMVHDLNPKHLHINGLFFSAKSKKSYLWGVFGHYPQHEIFSQKSCSVSFLPLRHPNFKRSFRKILYAVLEKTLLPSDILTYWYTDILTVVKSKDPFSTKCGGPVSMFPYFGLNCWLNIFMCNQEFHTPKFSTSSPENFS